MAQPDEKKLRNQDIPDEEEGGSGGESSGGSTGEIHFRYKDAMSVEPRDDLLPPSEIKRLLAVHKELHKDRVDKQKITRKERKALKEGRVTRVAEQGFRVGRGFGGGAGRYSPYKQHRIAQKAQFSGMDKQVIGLPSENRAETNEEQRDALENRLENRNELRFQNTPKFNPKPRPF